MWLLLHGVLAFAQTEITTIEGARAHYTIEIARQVQWPNDPSITTFDLGVLDANPGQLTAFQDRASRLIRSRPIRVVALTGAETDFSDYEIVYIGSRRRHQAEAIFSNTSRTLIVTDGNVDDRWQMVSLLSSSRTVDLTFNRQNLVSRGFTPTVNLLARAGTKEDITEQLRNTEAEFNDLQQQVRAREQRLQELNQILADNTQALELAKQSLAQREEELNLAQTQLDQLESRIRDSNRQVAKNQADIDAQQQLIEAKQGEIEAKQNQLRDNENKVAELQVQIDEKQSELSQQLQRIQQQGRALDSQEATIGTQRYLLTFMLVVAVIFLLMSFFLFKLNQLRKRANDQLSDLNSRLYEQATTDAMTGLYNRRHFLESSQQSIDQLLRKDGRAVVLMMDIDHFKKVNDTYGHAMGDEAIKFVAGVFKNNLRSYDIVGRLGGEEYAMLLAEADAEVGLEIAERLRREIEDSAIEFEGQVIRITISIGKSNLQPGDDVDKMLVRADKALYRSKGAGRNRVSVYDDSMA